MKVRYFEKRGEVWLDFRDAEGKRRRLPSGASTLPEAQRLAPGVIARASGAPAVPVIPRTASVPVSGMTLQQAFDAAMRSREQWIMSKAKHTLHQTFGSLTGMRPGDPVASLTRERVRELRAAWVQEAGKRPGSRLSASTINHRISMLSVLLKTADLLPHSVGLLSVAGTRRTRRISDREMGMIEAWCAANAERKGATDMASLVLLAMETAAREGEMLKLRPADVADGLATFRDTKNSESRTIPLTDAAQRILEARRGLAGATGRGFFPALDSSRITDLWAAMRTALGLADDREFVFHSLRHEAITRMVEMGGNAFAIQAVAGHTQIATTQLYVGKSINAMRSALGIPHAAAL